MLFSRFSIVASLGLLAGPVAAQVFTIPPGAYRTAAAYHRRQPQPAGVDAFFPDKRGQLVVVVPNGPQKDKLRLAPDSLWGFATGKGKAFRFFRGQEYQLDFADTLCVYHTNTLDLPNGQRGYVGASTHMTGQALATPQYYFSRGLTGLLFPLTARFLREAYGTSNPVFVAEVAKLSFNESLSDFDRKTGLYRVTALYRKAAGK